jgi:hypothetical protein
MYRAFFAIAVAGAVILLAAGRGDAQREQSATRGTPQKWEYRSLNEVELHRFYGERKKNSDIAAEPGWVDKALSGLGADGWELVTVERERFYLKRPTP